MQWHDLKEKEKAPAQGWVLAYTREKVIFRPYAACKELEEELGAAELLELHLFDDKKEYRCVATRSKRFADGVIETLVDFEEGKESVYPERIRITKGFLGQEITVLNHVSYDEANGMATIDNYRLRMGQGCQEEKIK